MADRYVIVGLKRFDVGGSEQWLPAVLGEGKSSLTAQLLLQSISYEEGYRSPYYLVESGAQGTWWLVMAKLPSPSLHLCVERGNNIGEEGYRYEGEYGADSWPTQERVALFVHNAFLREKK